MPSDDERRFGRDLDLPDDPDAPAPLTPTGDLATIAGRPAVHKNALRRLTSSPASMLHRPGFGAGLVDQIERMVSPTRRSATQNDARRNLLTDPRIADARVLVTPGLPGNPRALNAVTVEASVKLRGDETAEQLTTILPG